MRPQRGSARPDTSLAERFRPAYETLTERGVKQIEIAAHLSEVLGGSPATY